MTAENEPIFQNKCLCTTMMLLHAKDYANSVIYADKVLLTAKTDDNVKGDVFNISCSLCPKLGDQL
jgi:hypothetical protein